MRRPGHHLFAAVAITDGGDRSRGSCAGPSIRPRCPLTCVRAMVGSVVVPRRGADYGSDGAPAHALIPGPAGVAWWRPAQPRRGPACPLPDVRSPTPEGPTMDGHSFDALAKTL